MFNPLKLVFSSAAKAQGGHDFAAGEIPCYAQKDPVLSPFQRARQEWDDRIGGPVKQARNWRLVAVGSLGLSFLLGGALAYKAVFAPVELWAVPVDAAGVVAGPAARFAAQRFEPNRAQVAADIARWVEWVRTRPADGVKLRADLTKSHEFLGPDAGRKFKGYVEKYKPFDGYSDKADKVPRRTVTMTFPKVLPMEGNSYHAEWTETVWEHGQPRPPYTVTATFAATAKGQANEAMVNLNPAGTTILDFDWRGEGAP
jgi:type IV secretion system protein TrbF